MENGSAIDIEAQARLEGMNNIRASGLNKVRAGDISLEELHRVSKD